MLRDRRPRLRLLTAGALGLALLLPAQAVHAEPDAVETVDPLHAAVIEEAPAEEVPAAEAPPLDPARPAEAAESTELSDEARRQLAESFAWSAARSRLAGADGTPLVRVRPGADGRLRPIINRSVAAELGLDRTVAEGTAAFAVGAAVTQEFTITDIPGGVSEARFELLACSCSGDALSEEPLAVVVGPVDGDGEATIEFSFDSIDDPAVGYEIAVTPLYDTGVDFSFALYTMGYTAEEWEDADHTGSVFVGEVASRRLTTTAAAGTPASVTGASLRLEAFEPAVGPIPFTESVAVPLGEITLHNVVEVGPYSTRAVAFGIDDDSLPRTSEVRSAYLTARQLAQGAATVVTLAKPVLKKGTPKVLGTPSYAAGAVPLLPHAGFLVADVTSFQPVGPLAEVRYTWYRNGKAISGSDAPLYELLPTDTGKKLSVKAVVRITGTTKTVSGTSKAVTVKPNIAIAFPPSDVLEWNPVTRRLTARTQTVVTLPSAGRTSLRYQWYRDHQPVKGATRSWYQLSNADSGRAITAVVSASGSKHAPLVVPFFFPLWWSVVALDRPQLEFSAGIGAYVGQEVRLVDGTFSMPAGYLDEDGDLLPGSPDNMKVQWLRNGAVIRNAIQDRYVLQRQDIGKRISVRVTAIYDAFGPLPSIEVSDATAKVKARWIDPGSFSGLGEVAGAGTRFSVLRSGGTSGVKLSYQWYYDGRAVKKATKSSYTRSGGFDPELVSVRVTLKRSGYATASVVVTDFGGEP